MLFEQVQLAGVPLTTNIDTINVIGQQVNTVTGLQQADPSSGANPSTWNTGDVINGNNKTLVNLVANGTPGGSSPAPAVVELNNIASVNANLVANTTIDATEFNNVAQVNVTSGVTGKALTLTNVDNLSTVYALSNVGRQDTINVTWTAATVAGKADAANVAANSTGVSNDARSLINVSANDGIEVVNLATSGKNFVDVDGGSAAKVFTVTGNGTNDISIGSANDSLTLNASATTGANVLRVNNHLSGVADTIIGGSGADVLVAKINNTTASTVTGVETLALNFAASANYNGLYTTGVDTLDISNNGATGGTTATLNNIASTVDTLVFDTTATATNTATSVSFVAGTSTALEVDIGQVTKAGTSTTITAVGNLTLANTSGVVTVDSYSDKATTINTVGTLALGTATGLTINSNSASLTTGAVTGTKVTSLNVNTNVNKGSILVGGFDDALALTTIAVAATTGNVDLTNGSTKIGADDSLATINLSADTVGSTVYEASATIGKGTNATTEVNAILTASGSGVVNVNTDGALTYIGTVDATDNTGAVNLDFSAYSGTGATKGFTITLGDAVATDNNFVDVSGARGASVITGGAGDDVIIAGRGADILNGGAGDDFIIGNAGNDIVTLGAGADEYSFTDENISGTSIASTGATIAQTVANVGNDVLSSFVVADDTFVINADVFGAAIESGSSAGTLANFERVASVNTDLATTSVTASIIVVQAAADAVASVYYVDSTISSGTSINDLLTSSTAHATLIGTLSSVTGTIATTDFAVI